MPMPPYVIHCYTKDCPELAEYKIAARWSDGITAELKTYSLVCEKCLPVAFLDARRRRDACRLASGETLDLPGIFQLQRQRRDKQLIRLSRLEELFLLSTLPQTS